MFMRGSGERRPIYMYDMDIIYDGFDGELESDICDREWTPSTGTS